MSGSERVDGWSEGSYSSVRPDDLTLTGVSVLLKLLILLINHLLSIYLVKHSKLDLRHIAKKMRFILPKRGVLSL